MLDLCPTAKTTSRPSANSRSMQNTSDYHLSVCNAVFTIKRLNKGSYFCTHVSTAMTMESWQFYRPRLCIISLCQNFCFSHSLQKTNKKPLLVQNFRKHGKTLASSVTLEDDLHFLRVPENSKQDEKGDNVKQGYWKDTVLRCTPM